MSLCIATLGGDGLYESEGAQAHVVRLTVGTLCCMTNPNLKVQPSPVIRYSMKPMESYLNTPGRSGAYACPPLLDTPERWNLAYLSHDYEKTVWHKDPMFAVHVRRSTQTLLDGSGLDLCGMHDARYLVEGLLRLPAPRFVYLIRRHPVLAQLPLYVAYGEAWLDLIEHRSRKCLIEDGLDGDEMLGDDPEARIWVKAILERSSRR